MFWDHVAGVYDVFVNVVNRKAHQKLRKIVAELIEPEDNVLECACGTGMLSIVIIEIKRVRPAILPLLWEKPGRISSDSLQPRAISSFSWTQAIRMSAYLSPKDVFPAPWQL